MRRHVEPNDGGGVRHRVEPCGVMCMRRHLVLTVHTGSGAGHDIRTVLRISPPAGKSAVIPYHGDGTAPLITQPPKVGLDAPHLLPHVGQTGCQLAVPLGCVACCRSNCCLDFQCRCFLEYALFLLLARLQQHAHVVDA